VLFFIAQTNITFSLPNMLGSVHPPSNAATKKLNVVLPPTLIRLVPARELSVSASGWARFGRRCQEGG
jgi:hypothetical protein